MTNFVMKYYKN